MAKIVIDGTTLKQGRIGGALVFSSWKGIHYCMKKPRYVYRNVPSQKANRAKFARAVHAWQQLDIMTQYLWRALAYGKAMSGYEYYLKRFMEDRV
jgi:hypothetical protein